MSSPLSQLKLMLSGLMTRCCCYSFRKESQTLRKEEVPEMFHEPYIFTGYRPVDMPWSYYLKSIVTVHNESVNVWTHGLGIFCVLFSLLTFLKNFDIPADDIARCVIFFGACCMFNLALSAIAHLFHCKSQWYHFAFLFLDYMGVSIFIFGSGIVSMFICCSKPVHERFHNWFLPANVFFSWASCFACIYAKVKSTHNNSHRKCILLTGVVSQCVLVSLPTLWRFGECAMEPACKVQQVSHLIIMFTMLSMCGVTFGCHIPESLWPGRFDVLGHGHQWFHVIAVLAMMTQVWAIDVDIRLDQRARELPKPGVGELLGFLALLVVIEMVTVIYFMRSVSQSLGDGQTHELLKEEAAVDHKEPVIAEPGNPEFLSSYLKLENLRKPPEEVQNEAS